MIVGSRGKSIGLIRTHTFVMTLLVFMRVAISVSFICVHECRTLFAPCQKHRGYHRLFMLNVRAASLLHALARRWASNKAMKPQGLQGSIDKPT